MLAGHKCRSRQFLSAQRYFARIFPNLLEKHFISQTSLYKFPVALGRLYFPLPCCHKLDNINLVLEIWFSSAKWKTYIRLFCQKPTDSVFMGICFTVLRFGVTFTLQVLISAINLTPSCGRICNTLHGKMCSIPKIVLRIKNAAFLPSCLA